MSDATMSESCLNAQRALPSWYGKLPGAGDFVDRRMPQALAQSWERWFVRGIASMLENEARSLSERYALAPIWRFAIPAGAGAGNVQFGCVAPSCDRVGRRYPLIVAHVFEPDGLSRGAASWASASLPAISETLTEAMERAYGPEQFDRALAERMSAATCEPQAENTDANGWPNLLDYFDADGTTSFWWASTNGHEPPAAQAHTGALDSALFCSLFGGGASPRNVHG